MQFDCGITVKALKVGYKQMVQNYRWQCICHCFDIWEKDWLKYNKKKKKPLNKEKKDHLSNEKRHPLQPGKITPSNIVQYTVQEVEAKGQGLPQDSKIS